MPDPTQNSTPSIQNNPAPVPFGPAGNPAPVFPTAAAVAGSDTDIPPVPQVKTDTVVAAAPPVSPPSYDLPPVVVTSGTSGMGGKGSKKVVAAILGVLVLVGGIGAGIFLTGQRQNIQEKAWFFSTDPDIGTQCPAYAQYTSEEIGTFQGTCSVHYCPNGFTQACAAGVTPGAWSQTLPCSSITEAYGDNQGAYQNYCVQVDYMSDNNLYCNIASPSCDTANPPPGGCGAKELSQVDLNGNGIYNEAADCTSTPPEPTNTPTPTPKSTPEPEISCKEIRAYRVTGTLSDTDSWSRLSAGQLSDLKSGDVVYFTVIGTSDQTTNNGGFDKAEFTINNGTPIESTSLKPKLPGDTFAVEYYLKYTILTNQTNYNVEARLHHITAGWM